MLSIDSTQPHSSYFTTNGLYIVLLCLHAKINFSVFPTENLVWQTVTLILCDINKLQLTFYLSGFLLFIKYIMIKGFYVIFRSKTFVQKNEKNASDSVGVNDSSV